MWRWKKDAGTASGFSNTPFVAEYVYPTRSSAWKIMLWSNNRLVLVTNTSISLWTQRSPCPAGTLTSNASSTDPLTKRCICPAGTFNNLVDFRKQVHSVHGAWPVLHWWILSHHAGPCLPLAGLHLRQWLCEVHGTKRLPAEAARDRHAVHRQRDFQHYQLHDLPQPMRGWEQLREQRLCN